jgi:uncharacterized protein with HEPN domain
MSRDWRLSLDDIRTACGKIAHFAEGMDRTAFFADDRSPVTRPDLVGVGESP